jgi:hypothetical protein
MIHFYPSFFANAIWLVKVTKASTSNLILLILDSLDLVTIAT